MAKRQSRFMVGLFVMAGILIGVAAIVWLGAANYFQKGTRYVTYFDESVQGLQVDSRVKYRGVEVGSVEKIGVASDQRLVEVIVKVDLEGFLQSVKRSLFNRFVALFCRHAFYASLRTLLDDGRNAAAPQTVKPCTSCDE